MTVAASAPTEFELCRRDGQRLVEAGRLEEALAAFESALALALASGEQQLVDLAVCNRAAVAVELGRGDPEVPRLREILSRNADTVSYRLAAYNVARHYELTKQYKKGLFYARVALDRSLQLERRDWRASSHNLIGNLLLADNLIAEACGEFDRAFELMPLDAAVPRARVLDNLGYCRVLQRRFDEGYRLLFESLRTLRRHGARRYQISTLLDLCFADLETGRYRQAGRHGRLALQLAETMGDEDSISKALYLVGEAAQLGGDRDAAYGYFARLQRDFHQEPALAGFLLAVDVRSLVNLHS